MSTWSRASCLFVAALVVALASVHSVNAQCDVRVMGWIMNEMLTPAIVLNVVANRVGDSTPILPEIIPFGDTLTIAEFRSLPEGDYEVTAREPGFYHYTATFTISASDYSLSQNVWLVPVSGGVTVLVNFLESSSFMFWSNITIPASAGFDTAFTGFSLYETSGSKFKYMWGTPPAAIKNWYWTTTLTGTRAGTYRFYMDALQLPGLSYNFSQERAHVSLFAGSDPATGWKGNFKSEIQDAISWYVGDIVVTNPSQGCSRYHWQSVNSYSLHLANDQTDHGQGTFIAEECIDVSPAALACAEKIYSDDVDTLVCGAFGDPHVVTFDNNGVTCGYDPIITLVDNDFFSITADTRFLNGTNNATAINAITLTYKGYCNPTSIKFNDVAMIEDTPFNSPHAFHHRVYVIGNNAYVDALHLRLQVRTVDGSVVFGISMPTSLISQSTGICVSGCRAGTSIDETAALRKRDPAEIQLALDACTDAGLTPGTFEYNACLFDVSSTSDVTFANAAVQSNVMRAEVGQSWTSGAAPSPSPSPSDKTGSASSITYSIALIFGALMAMVAF